MTTYRTGNAIGSTDPRDLYDNSENLDEFVNSPDKLSHPDRLGVPRKTWHGMEEEFVAAQADKQQRFNALLAASGYVFVGDYAAGITVSEYNEVIRDDAGNLWRAASTVELPYTTDGSGLPEGGAFVSAGDAVLRNDLMGEPVNGQGALRVRGSVIYVDTIADLQALPTSELVAGQVVCVKEYHAGTGVGGGEFYWDPSRTLENDGGVVLSGFVRLFDGPVHVEWYGARGDGVTDDTLSIDAAIQSEYSDVEMLGETYLIDGTLKRDLHPRRFHAFSVPSNKSISLGSDTTIKVAPTSEVSYGVFQIGPNVDNIKISGGTLLGEKLEHIHTGVPAEWGHGIRIQDSSNITITHVKIKDMLGDGISAGRFENIRISNCIFEDCRRHELTIAHGYGIYVTDTDLTKSNYDNDGVHNTTYGGLNVDIEPDSAGITDTVVFQRCKFKTITNSCIATHPIEGQIYRNISIIDCQFIEASSAIRLGAENIKISGCVFVREGTGAPNSDRPCVRVSNSTRVWVEGCSFPKDEPFYWNIQVIQSEDVHVKNNTAEDSVLSGIFVSNSDKVLVEGNIIDGGPMRPATESYAACITVNNCSNVTAHNNVIFSKVRHGIYLGNSSDVVVSGNQIRATVNVDTAGNHPIRARAGSSALVTGNDIDIISSGTVSGAIFFQDEGTTGTVIGNKVRNSGGADLTNSLRVLTNASVFSNSNDFFGSSPSTETYVVSGGGNYLSDGTVG